MTKVTNDANPEKENKNDTNQESRAEEYSNLCTWHSDKLQVSLKSFTIVI